MMEEYILDTRFELNVKSMTNFPGQLNIQGRIISVAGGTASEFILIIMCTISTHRVLTVCHCS